MVFKNFTSTSLEELNSVIVAQRRNAVVLITASWSGAARIIAPALEAFALQYRNDVHFLMIDYDQEENLDEFFDITVLPTLLFYKQGSLVDQLTGTFAKEQFGVKLANLYQ